MKTINKQETIELKSFNETNGKDELIEQFQFLNEFVKNNFDKIIIGAIKLKKDIVYINNNTNGYYIRNSGIEIRKNGIKEIGYKEIENIYYILNEKNLIDVINLLNIIIEAYNIEIKSNLMIII